MARNFFFSGVIISWRRVWSTGDSGAWEVWKLAASGVLGTCVGSASGKCTSKSIVNVSGGDCDFSPAKFVSQLSLLLLSLQSKLCSFASQFLCKRFAKIYPSPHWWLFCILVVCLYNIPNVLHIGDDSMVVSLLFCVQSGIQFWVWIGSYSTRIYNSFHLGLWKWGITQMKRHSKWSVGVSLDFQRGRGLFYSLFSEIRMRQGGVL